MRSFLFVALSAVLATVSVNAADNRLDYKLAKNQTVDQFCSKWNTACNTYIHKHYPGSTPGIYCEAGPKTGEVQVYCSKYVITQYTNTLAKEIGATAA
ncbi:hypothetical protein Unana1_04836 [Umbelopsis nana]